jgi:two-component sensor histidine kinase
VSLTADTAALQKKILILHGDAQFSPAQKTMDQTFESVFSKSKTFETVIYSENLEEVRFKTAAQRQKNIELLTERYSGLKLDLIMATDIFALKFLISHGEKIFKLTPVVFCGISEGSIDPAKLPDYITGNFKNITIRENIKNILLLQPDVSEIFIIVGTDIQDLGYERIALECAGDFSEKVKFTVLKNYSLEEITGIISAKPADTAALYLAIHEDGTGHRYSPQEALGQITAKAAIPVYGIADITLDYGVIGGNLFGFKDLSYNAAMIGMDVLNGKKTSDILIAPSKSRNYFDWNRLKKWNIDIRNLPPDSVLLNKPPDPWVLYKTQIISIIIFFIIALILIIALVIQLRLKQMTENKLRHLNRDLRTISECNQAMLRATNEYELLSETCSIICNSGGYRMAWVGYAQNDEKKSVKPVSWGGYEDGYLESINISWADTERGQGPTGTCIRTKKSCYIQNFTTNPDLAPWRKEALRRGYYSSIALPLIDENGGIFGALMVYASTPNAFTPEEIRLLEGLSGDLAFGINFLRTRSERIRAEESIKNSLMEKEVLLRELYHRTKNNMQVISSLLRIQLSYTQDNKLAAIFQSLQDRIQSMALVQQKLYASKDLSIISLKEYIIDLAKLLIESYRASEKRIKLDLTGLEEIPVTVDCAIPCGLVLNEIISNSLKHAFPGDITGEIRITLGKTSNDEIEFSVSDTGIGVDPSFDFKTDSKMGLKTAINIIENQLRGQVLINREHGLTFTTRFRDIWYNKRV